MTSMELKTPRILLVEDEALIAAQIEQVLIQLGYEVATVVASGELAVQRAEEEFPDVVLMDIVLEGELDGIEAAEQIQTKQNIPVIYLTSYAERNLIERAKITEPFGYLLKPVQQGVLRATIEMALYKHRIEIELKETNHRLEQEIVERKRVEEELENAKKIAETASRVKSEFLANMSHELRTPLNGILGYTQILRRDPHLTESQGLHLESIERSGRHLLKLINDILDLSKIEARKIELDESEIYLPEFLMEISEMIRVQAQQKGIAFRYETTSMLPHVVRTDERHLREILLNLLSNAVKFTEQGGVTLRVGLRIADCGLRIADSEDRQSKIQDLKPVLSDAEGSDAEGSKISKIRFEVSDSGVGIPEDQLQEIFSPFTQLGRHTRKVEGTGLGLAISRELVQLMGSELFVKSTVGKGSTFWFDVDCPEIENVIKLEARQTPSIIGFKGDTKKVLLVDDKEDNRAILKGMLLPLGFEIMEAVDGQDALNKARKSLPDLIFMDLVMPVMDGFEATRRIRQISALEDIPVIAISASVFEHIRQESLAAGCNGFITKPVSFEEILEQLKTCLDLEWIVARKQWIPKKDNGQSTYALPPKHELQALFHAARTGNILEIRYRLDHLEQSDASLRPFTQKVRELATNFQIKDIYELLEKALQNTD